MSLSSGAYFAIHSGVSQCLRSTSAARVALLEWMGPLSRTMVTGARHSRLGAMDAIEPFEQGDEIGAAFGLRGHDSELAGNEVERAHLAIFCDWPGASTRKSAPRFAQARAR